MKYKSFAALPGVALPVLGIGTWAMGGTWSSSDDNNSLKALHRAFDQGISFVDTAPIYGKGHAEEIVGKAMTETKRENLFLATKCGLSWNQRGKVRLSLEADNIKAEIEQSLERLKTDYIDLYQCHWPDPKTSIEETMEALAELKDSGKIRYVGVSNFTLDMLRESEKYLDIVSYQGLYNIMEQNATHYHRVQLNYESGEEIIPHCIDKGSMFLPYSPLMQGLLSGTWKSEGNFQQRDDRMSNPKLRSDGGEFKKYLKAAEDLHTFALDHGYKLVDLALGWLISQETVGPVLCGMRKPEYVESGINSIHWKLSMDELTEVDRILKQNAAR